MIDFVVCVGNGDGSADLQAQQIAKQNNIPYRGFLDPGTELSPGCYHTGIYDIKLAEFQAKLTPVLGRLKIVALDQDQHHYSNLRDYQDTVEMIQALANQCPVEWITPQLNNQLTQALKQNNSFCILPFIALKDNSKHCCYMEPFDSVYTDFYTDPNSVAMRQHMLAGEKTSLCNKCYAFEEYGAASPRQLITRDWIYRLNLKSYDQVIERTKLINYEIFLGNGCNLQCRMCDPSSSNLIDAEYAALGLSDRQTGLVNHNYLDTIDLDTVQQLTVTGGEPSINPDFYNFLKRCVQTNRTDFVISINTNGVALTKKFIALIKHFKRVQIVISIDGFDQVNRYIRWPTDWEKLKRNITVLTESVAPDNYLFSTTLSIYNISQLYQLYEFLDFNYPTAVFDIALLTAPSYLQAWNFPDKDVALQNLNKIKILNKYHKDQSFKSAINGIIQRLDTATVDWQQLQAFYSFNDQLDRSRQVRLKDYIPELDHGRRLLDQ